MNRRTAAAAGALLLSVSMAPVAHARGQERHTHHAAAEVSGLGAVSFANSGAAAAQPAFQRGLAFLHSFEYDQAAEAFRAAQTRRSVVRDGVLGRGADLQPSAVGRGRRRRRTPRARTGWPPRATRGWRRPARRGSARSERRSKRCSSTARCPCGCAGSRTRCVSWPSRIRTTWTPASFAALASMFAAYVGDLRGDRAAGGARRRRRLRAAGVHRATRTIPAARTT